VTGLRGDDADGVRIITFDRPAARNALTIAMRRDFCAMVDDADRDPAIKAVVVTGTDPAFTAGVDFNEQDPDFDPRQRRFAVNPGRALRATRTPTVCAVNGACVSGGLEIALSATFIVASERARFADTHARLGVVPAWGLTSLLPRAVGLRRAREMSLTGDFVDADEARHIGLANHVVPHADLLRFTTDLARQFADSRAATDMLVLYDQGTDLGSSAALALESAQVTRGPEWDGQSFAAAGRAIVEKGRTP
jgi:enoyl-CoA hydratase